MIYLSLGSNLGNRLSNLRKAVAILQKRCFSFLEESIVIETPALLLPNAPAEWNKPYLNMIVRGKTPLLPEELLGMLQQIEQEMGRHPDHPKWSPRTIDIDILLWNQEMIDTPSLKVPHPELLNRPFWFHTIAMLCPEARIPTHPELTIGDIAHKKLHTNPCFTKSFSLKLQCIGVVNITPDSFSDGGLYLKSEQAIRQIQSLNEDGASVIEIGAQSTRPGSPIISAEKEYQRLEPVLEGIKEALVNQEITLSLDSFSPETILKALKNYPIAWINDVKGDLSNHVLSEIASYGCSFVAMHCVTIPPSQQEIIPHTGVIQEWAEKTLAHLISRGFNENRIILDPGIGFGKSAYQNLWLLKHIRLLKKLPCPILAGHSRKSYINTFYPSEPAHRDLETIAISNELSEAGVDYLRVHDVAAHQRFFVAKQSIRACKQLESSHEFHRKFKERS